MRHVPALPSGKTTLAPLTTQANTPQHPERTLGSYDANTNTLNLYWDEYHLLLPDQRAGELRALMWHEMGHWLYHHAKAHPRLENWKKAIHAHWYQRVQGQPIRTHKQGWRYILDGWLNEYAGRLYPTWEGGVEIPSVYFEEVSRGPENIAYWCLEEHQKETFGIVTSIFGQL
ncbi:hypothetical protein EI77_04647 [Prosthecobacter fusiformis]|uniref:Uncharacterized protein n=1 Tax=Prosthecobacter fusiformis TaxID=48464 RepID=A0A4R7RJR8_9BACT|nr:hypothetical protein [Prosthecobacter fusiformis]TDU62546.1 hypothetical protein EI77_04647 [Prosthecobacter fusiformis]